MRKRKLRIAHIAAEVAPFSRSGGLANVIGSLPKTQRELGHDVIIIAPYYEEVHKAHGQTAELIAENESVEITSGIFETASYFKGTLPESDVPVYFVAHRKYFGKKTGSGEGLYGAKNDNARFLFFDVAALALLKKIEWKPDLIHCHDWHTGLIPYFLKNRYRKEPFWDQTACLFTIHNLTYQLGHDWWLGHHRDDGRTPLPPFTSKRNVEYVNFVKRAVMNADAINTVSETYRDEILTKDFGEDLHRILKNREQIIFGIINGIDYNEYNPLTDPGLRQHYSEKSVGRKKDNKLWLQRHYQLKVSGTIPLICMTSRVVEQKGFALLLEVMPALMNLGVQMIIMGDGDERLVKAFDDLQKRFPKQLVRTPFDSALETSLYAGSDFFLLPSRFEPCGINQLIALRYGCIPIVHHIGGLADTVVDFDPETKTGSGFSFTRFDAGNLLIIIVRALETYKHKEVWKRLIMSGLREANSWIIPAKKYIDLYRTTILLGRRAKKKARQQHA